MFNEAIAAIVGVLAINGLLGMILAFNVFGASNWAARRYANVPRWLRVPGQDRPQVYRFSGGVMIVLTCIALVWVALRAKSDLMNWDWFVAIIGVLALLIVPRLMLEWAWSRRQLAKARASGRSISFADGLRAQSVPWIVFATVGLLCAGAAFAWVALSH
jgi:hypothetical protein